MTIAGVSEFPSGRNRYLVLGGLGALAALMGAAVASNAWTVVAGILALAAGAAVLAFPRPAAVLTVALSASELLIPEPSGQLRVFVLGVLTIVAWRALDDFWSGHSQPRTASRVLIGLFVAVMIGVIAARGIGFQALGDSKAGGFLYVRLLAMAGFALYLPGVRLTDAAWQRALVAMCLLATLPLLADLAAVYVRPLATTVAALFHLSPSVEGAVFGSTTDGTTFRWFSAMSLSTYITLLLFLTEDPVDRGTRLSSKVIAGLLVAFAIASLSGHRLAILNVLGIATLVLLLDGRLTLRRVLTGLAILGIVLIALRLLAPSLPMAVQRSISWIPGIAVSAEAGSSASYSVTWRLAVWILALQEVPKYLLIGRGLAYERADATAAASAHLMSGEANWAIVQGYFHNGWLSLLILFGVVGLLVGFALLVSLAIRHVRLARRSWRSPALQRYHRVLTAWLLLQVLSYWIIYGDVQVSFPEMLFAAGLLDALRSDDSSRAITPNAAMDSTAAG